MSEREQQLETALRRAFYLGEVHWQQADSESYRQNAKAGETQQKLEALVTETVAALATPPTSEWNEAIEAAALFCEDVASALDAHGHFPDTAQKEITDIANSIRVLKRKEQP